MVIRLGSRIKSVNKYDFNINKLVDQDVKILSLTKNSHLKQY